jgi:heptosyltransferase III
MLKSPQKRIAMILLRAMGDVVLTTPAIRVLKQHFLQADIDFITNSGPAEILQGNPYLSQIVRYPYTPQDVIGALKFAMKLRSHHYDIVIDFLGTPATALLTWYSGAAIRVGYNLRFRKLAYTHLDQGYIPDIYNPLSKFPLLKPLGIQDEETMTEVFPPAEAEKWVDQLFTNNSWDQRRVVALATCATNPVRRWRPQRFAEMAKWLSQKHYQVILVWGPGEFEYVKTVEELCSGSAVMTPPTEIMQLAALLRRCCLLIANCGGTKHVAVAVGTPTLTIHGPSDPRVWTPSGDPRHTFVRGQLDCLKCNEKECKTLECMEAVSTEMVIAKIEEMGILL